MKVVGIDLIKLFRNFKFEKSAVILTGYMAIAGYFLVDFDMKKKVCSVLAKTSEIDHAIEEPAGCRSPKFRRPDRNRSKVVR